MEVDERSHFTAVEQSRPKEVIIELPDICLETRCRLSKHRFIRRTICRSVLFVESFRVDGTTLAGLNKAIQYSEA